MNLNCLNFWWYLYLHCAFKGRPVNGYLLSTDYVYQCLPSAIKCNLPLFFNCAGQTRDAGSHEIRQQGSNRGPLCHEPRGVCVAQRMQSCFSPRSPGFESRLRQDFFSLLLSWWTVLRSNPSSAKQWISQMQLAVTSRAKYYKKMSWAKLAILLILLKKAFYCVLERWPSRQIKNWNQIFSKQFFDEKQSQGFFLRRKSFEFPSRTKKIEKKMIKVEIKKSIETLKNENRLNHHKLIFHLIWFSLLSYIPTVWPTIFVFLYQEGS